MVHKADVVFRGKVLSQRAEWTNLNGRKSIVTIVQFEVTELFKGSAGKDLELRCPGGTIGDTTLELVGAPSFANGEQCVLFVRTNASVVCPIVGIYHGKLLLKKNETGETLSHHNGRPINDISEIGRDDSGPMAASPVVKNTTLSSRGPVTLSELKTRIREEVGKAASVSGGK